MTHSSPLRDTLEWWASRDHFGGFATAGATLFPGWTPRRSSCRAPRREDRSPSFSLYRGTRGDWRFKDHATGEKGGLVDFVMLAGMPQKDACRWLMDAACGHAQYATTSPSTPRVAPVAWSPYKLSIRELNRTNGMADALVARAGVLRPIAEARGWQYHTLRRLALDDSLGLHEGRLVMLYPTGAKKRFKPFDPQEARVYEGPKFAWMFGKPDSLWRSHRLNAETRHVHITEGETDAITLINAGLEESLTERVVAVPGASCWRNEWAGQFRGLHVTIWPDFDAPGQRLAARICESLNNVAAKVEAAALSNDTLFSQKAHCA